MKDKKFEIINREFETSLVDLYEDIKLEVIENFKDSPYNESQKILERVKTLNFHINTAFGRLDQLLRQIETKINKEDEHKSTS